MPTKSTVKSDIATLEGEDRPQATASIQPEVGNPGMRKTGPRHTVSINPKVTSAE